MSLRVLIAEDHPLVCEGLRQVLGREPGLAIVGEVGDGLQVVPAVQKLRPEILLLDLVLPNLHGLEVLRQVSQAFPRTRVVVLSMWASEAYVSRALLYGAWAYVLKDAETAEVARAIRAVMAGRRYLCPPLSHRVLEDYMARLRSEPPDPYEALSTQEREVLQLCAQGLTSAEIAARLFLSPRTVETHRSRLMHKIGVKSHAELLRFALKRGLLPLEPPDPV